MQSLAQRFYIESEVGDIIELPNAGSSLENPYVYDASAKELKTMVAEGLLKIVDERRAGAEGLINRLVFERLR